MKPDLLGLWINALLIGGAWLLGGPRWAGVLALGLGVALAAHRVMEGRSR